MNLEFLEIASVALLPRNDAENSRFICDEILGSSPRMTQGLGNSRIFVIANEAKQSLGILNSSLEILNLSLGILDLF